MYSNMPKHLCSNFIRWIICVHGACFDQEEVPSVAISEHYYLFDGTEEGDSSPNEPEAEMEIIEPLDMLHMRKYLNLVSFQVN